MQRNFRFLILVVVLLFAVAVDGRLQAQTLLWKKPFPLVEGFSTNTIPIGNPADSNYVTRVFSFYTSSSGDGLGGSAWAGNFNASRMQNVVTNAIPPFFTGDVVQTNTVRVLWLNKLGKGVFTNDLQTVSTNPSIITFPPVGITGAQVQFVRQTTNELVFQLTSATTNLLRRINRVGTRFTIKDTALEIGDAVEPNLRSPTDASGTTVMNAVTGDIKRFSNR